MPKPDSTTIPEFFQKYVRLVEENDAAAALSANTEKALGVLNDIPDEKWDYRYAEGKWSIRDMVQHLTDAERIFSYRALCIARGETQSLPGFDENTYAAAANADRRSKEDLINEFQTVRKGTEALFQSFDDEQLAKMGTANNNPVSVNGIGFITVGHVLHHLNVIRERYL